MAGIGGFGQVVTIFEDRIEERILQRWAEDKVWAFSQPTPIVWTRWHAENPKPAERKARKFGVVR
jgi:hypothetical protein